jgi:hypothetical protein
VWPILRDGPPGLLRMRIGDSARAILATLVRDFRFDPVEGHRIELAPDFTTRPKGGLPLWVTPV